MPSFINVKVSDVQHELEHERLKFGDPDQIAKLNVLRKAEGLIGQERWDNKYKYKTYTEWTRSEVYSMSAKRLMDGDYITEY